MNKCLALAAFCVPLSAAAEVVYDNSDNFQLKINSTLLESGDQVRLAGENRVINFFAFEYFASPSVTSNGGSGRVRFYLNDGATTTNGFAAPGTLLYDSGSFLLNSNASTVEISGLNIYVPSDTLTWTVEFSNIRTNERAGVRFYDPPRVGSSENFLWTRENGAWQAISGTNGVVNNLSGHFEAIAALRIKGLAFTNNAVTVRAAAFDGKSYELQYKTNLAQQGWTTVTNSVVSAVNGEATLEDPTGTTNRFRLYRVMER